MVFEFTSTILFGQEREDFVFSLSSDTLRIVDRERGAYYEGDDAVWFLAESLEADFDVPQALSLAFGGQPPLRGALRHPLRGRRSRRGLVRG